MDYAGGPDIASIAFPAAVLGRAFPYPVFKSIQQTPAILHPKEGFPVLRMHRFVSQAPHQLLKILRQLDAEPGILIFKAADQAVLRDIHLI